MEIITFAFIYIVTSIIIGGFCSWIAGTKGYGQVTWFFLGVLFSVVSLISISGASAKREFLEDNNKQNLSSRNKRPIPSESVGAYGGNKHNKKTDKLFTPEEESAIKSIPEDFFNSMITEYNLHEDIETVLKNYRLVTGFYILNKGCLEEDINKIKNFFRECEYI